MQGSKHSQSMLTKPFKSPARKHPTRVADTSSTPTGASQKKRPAPPPDTEPLPLRKLTVGTPTPSNKRQRLPQTTGISAKRQPRKLSVRGLPPRFSLRDEEALALVQEKNGVLRELAKAKEEVALLERALTLSEKKEASVVNGLIAKWQIACSAASNNLFDLLKPMMEAQRQASQLGFDYGDPGGRGSESEAAAAADEDIDIPYMLRRLGIDPELF
ncbi:hypothetical protein H4R26_002995 [Coemansia thaxteri]|uniref:Uncharacterized protein n=1 Tax=Coemansia thaxteri TaxID=2663907 RepID=A0A9W8BJP8_9FUNG|nr:hypothetical protein H4R26_002995 [Coemansia thaxteri]